jgi:hypothetical protein
VTLRLANPGDWFGFQISPEGLTLKFSGSVLTMDTEGRRWHVGKKFSVKSEE